MIGIKICGLRREEDINYSNLLKPDYVGFVFAKSKRQVDKYKAKELIKKLDKDIKKVGVFLNEDKNKVCEIVKYCNLDIIQLHGDESPYYCRDFNFRIWKAIRVKGVESFKEIEKYDVDGFLFDTYTEGNYGGTGKYFDWRIIPSRNDKYIVLAGGLNIENIEEAVKISHPNVVDVSSGVEIDGYKDFEKMKKFILKVREI